MRERWEYAQLHWQQTNPIHDPLIKVYWKTAGSKTLQFEMKYDWEAGEWSSLMYDTQGKPYAPREELDLWITVLDEVGGSGWELVSERSMHGATTIHTPKGYFNEAFPTSIMCTFKRRKN